MIYGYLRVSTEAQDLESQKIGIDSYCEKNNIVIDQWVTEKVSGMKEVKSRRLGTLQAKLRKGDTLIAAEISRLGRSSLMILSLVEKLFKRGVTMIFIKQGLNLEAGDGNLQSMMAKMFVCFSALYAEMERELMKGRVKEGIERRKRQGLPFGRPGGKPWLGSPMKPYLPEMKRLYSEGRSLSELAKIFPFTVSGISRALRSAGIITRPRGYHAA
jgi:DNA invertase Pin-like site-specific DNA recombinase